MFLSNFLGAWLAEMLKSYLTNCVKWGKTATPGKDQNSNYLELHKLAKWY